MDLLDVILIIVSVYSVIGLGLSLYMVRPKDFSNSEDYLISAMLVNLFWLPLYIIYLAVFRLMEERPLDQ